MKVQVQVAFNTGEGEAVSVTKTIEAESPIAAIRQVVEQDEIVQERINADVVTTVNLTGNKVQ